MYVYKLITIRVDFINYICIHVAKDMHKTKPFSKLFDVGDILLLALMIMKDLLF